MRFSIQDRDLEFREAYGFGIPIEIPGYRACGRGGWEVRRGVGGLCSRSYVAETCIEVPHAVLSRGETIWMSTTLLELESHAWHLHRARGTVVVAGLGLGMFVHAAAAKPNVVHVIAAEIDRNVVDLMRECSDFAGWPFCDKITFIEEDALDPSFPDAVAMATGGIPPDYLYADIWPCYPAEQAPTETARMVASLHPTEAGWWGQELSLACWLNENAVDLTEEACADYFAAVGVPVRLSDGYRDFCRDVAAAHDIDLSPGCVPAFE